nr:serine/threonine-protein phosphatase [Propionibacterium sp.]
MGGRHAEPVFRVSAGAASDVGHVRLHNEDAYLAAHPVFLVADGMGGHTRGDAAAAAVVRVFERLGGRSWLDAAELHEATAAAASEIEELAGHGRAPGTTLAGVATTRQADRPYWLVFNVGDSRIYLLRDGRLEQLSVDHSRRQDLIDAGIDPDEVRIGRNIITRALGAGRPGVPVLDQWLLPAQGGDRMLVCTDGLTAEVSDDQLLATLTAHADPQDAARALVAGVLTGAARDNVTAVVVDAVEVAGAETPVDDEDAATQPEGAGLDDDTVDLSEYGLPLREE